MGCGISRPALDEDATAHPGLLPIRRRIEEIKRNRLRSHKRSKSELSSRDLLGRDDEPLAEEESLQGDGRKSVSSRLESIQEVPFMEKMKRNDSSEFKDTAPPPIVKKLDENDDIHKHENKEEEKHSEAKVDEKQIENKQNEDNVLEVKAEFEVEEIGNRLGEGPGSPSFREYCFQSSDESEETTKEESKSEEEKGEEKHRDSIDSSEGSTTELVPKKEHRGRRFRRVLPKGGQAAVKNLLNVTGCYCSNPLNHSNPRLAPVPTS